MIAIISLSRLFLNILDASHAYSVSIESIILVYFRIYPVRIRSLIIRIYQRIMVLNHFPYFIILYDIHFRMRQQTIRHWLEASFTQIRPCFSKLITIKQFVIHVPSRYKVCLRPENKLSVLCSSRAMFRIETDYRRIPRKASPCKITLFYIKFRRGLHDIFSRKLFKTNI